jgi:hypothetical protein
MASSNSMFLQLPVVAGKTTAQRCKLTIQTAAAAKHKEPASAGSESVS